MISYHGLKWKNCPFCKTDNVKVDDEWLFDRVKKEHGRSALSISCNCGCQLWVYPREVEVNDYESMIVALNNKWNKGTNNKK